MNTTPAVSYSLGPLSDAVRARLRLWDDERFGERMWAKDHTLWSAEEVSELTDRLGWLWLPDDMKELVVSLSAFADEIRADADHEVLLGMGGSRLAPEVYQSTFGNADGYPELLVLDSTHPGAVAAVPCADRSAANGLSRLVQIRRGRSRRCRSFITSGPQSAR